MDAGVKSSPALALSWRYLIEITRHKDLKCLKMPGECSDKLNTSRLTAGGFSPPGWDTKSDMKPQNCGGGKQFSSLRT